MLPLLSALPSALALMATPTPTPNWIWIEGEGPPTWAPAADRYFRRTFELDDVPAKVELAITADDTFDATINGKPAAQGTSWEQLYHVDIAPLLRRGTNVLAVCAKSTLPGPGALVVRITGLAEPLVSDARFRVTRDAPAEGWREVGFDDSSWEHALVIGPLGCPPWGSGIADQFEGAHLIEDIIATYRSDDPVLVVPTPRGRLSDKRDVTLGRLGRPLGVRYDGVPADSYAIELLDRGLAAFGVAVEPRAASPAIRLVLAPQRDSRPQAYSLDIRQDEGVRIRAADTTGLVYGVATLLQMLRVNDGQLVAPDANLDDYPAAEIRGPVVAPYSPNWLDFGAYFRLNAWFVGDVPPATVVSEAKRRGIGLMPARHLPDEYDFQSDEALNEIAQWALSAADAGLRWVTVNADDHPEKVYTEADRQRFGDELPGLAKAHAHFINRLKPLLGGRIELVFCPRVYYKIQAGTAYPRAHDERAYLENLAKGIEEPLLCWITEVSPSFLRESAERFRTPPLAWHNFFPGDTTDWKVYYEAYPVVREPGSARGFFVLGNTQEPDLWRPNYLTFAGNTWNPERPIGLREAFTALYGVRAGTALTRYAELAGGHDRPIGVMADFWDQPLEVAPRFLGSGWAGVVPGAERTPELLARCQALATSAAEAAAMPLEAEGVPPAMAQRLTDEAMRTHLAFSLWSHRIATELGQPWTGEDPAALRMRLADLIERLGLPGGATDLELTKGP
ncbi:MAG TPA: glycoside hydrolase family 20 zincin-like fold domain-containing protein [Armatimonadota bacterium]|nr:glycoside hydrolase family 20 zincin-like fold domain-containing protein [Armatimonadota bacterium]